MRKGMKRMLACVAFFILHSSFFISTTVAQNFIDKPDISYAGTPREVEIGGISVKGVTDYEDYVLINLSGLSVGQHIDLPGQEITEAVKRYWKHGLFSKVSIQGLSLHQPGALSPYQRHCI